MSIKCAIVGIQATSGIKYMWITDEHCGAKGPKAGHAKDSELEAAQEAKRLGYTVISYERYAKIFKEYFL